MAKGVYSVANNYYLGITASPPISMCAWVYQTTPLGSSAVIALTAASGSIFHRIYGYYVRGYLNSWQALSRQNVIWESAQVTANDPTYRNKWVFVCGVFPSDDSRSIYVWNGTAMATQTNNVSLLISLTQNRLGIGGAYTAAGGVQDVFGVGYISRASFWNTDLSADEVAMLSQGYSPLKIQPNNLLSYVPMTREIRNIASRLNVFTAGSVPHRSEEPPITPYSGVPL